MRYLQGKYRHRFTGWNNSLVMIKERCLPALFYYSLGLLIVMLSAGCSALAAPDLPTPYPTEYIPTVLAMTVEAGRQEKTGSARPTATVPSATPRPTTGVAPPPPTNARFGQRAATAHAYRRATPLPTPTRTRIPSKTPTITPTPGIPPG